jgi:hypothetical protein
MMSDTRSLEHRIATLSFGMSLPKTDPERREGNLPLSACLGMHYGLPMHTTDVSALSVSFQPHTCLCDLANIVCRV